jgi:5-formyltetrahydrofolate cyclo-ligase
MIFDFFKKVKKFQAQSKAEKKAFIRESFGDTWFSLTKKQRRRTSQQAEYRLTQYLEKINAKCVLFYASMEDEPSTDDILDKWIGDPDKTLVLTRVCNKTKQLDPYIVTSWDDLEMGRFRIRMPKKTCQQVDLVQLDAIVVPGRAFDEKKNRLGRGFGFYDRFLSVIPCKVRRIGLAFEFQVVDPLPVEKHDMGMDVVITERRVIS